MTNASREHYNQSMPYTLGQRMAAVTASVALLTSSPLLFSSCFFALSFTHYLLASIDQIRRTLLSVTELVFVAMLAGLATQLPLEVLVLVFGLHGAVSEKKSSWAFAFLALYFTLGNKSPIPSIFSFTIDWRIFIVYHVFSWFFRLLPNAPMVTVKSHLLGFLFFFIWTPSGLGLWPWSFGWLLEAVGWVGYFHIFCSTMIAYKVFKNSSRLSLSSAPISS